MPNTFTFQPHTEIARISRRFFFTKRPLYELSIMLPNYYNVS